MLGNSQFYHRTIRKVVVAFGTVFNDILLQRYNADGLTKREVFKVPLSYGAKEKYLTRITSDPNLTKSVATVVPRISFEMVSMSYDTGRKLNTLTQNFAANTATAVKTQYRPIPYNFEFNLSIYVRNTEDGTQILEQILPFFTPDFTVTVNFIPEMNQKYDMPIVLNSVNSTVDYEGDMLSTRLIMWDLTFTAKSYIWPPVKSGKYIRQANTNVYIDSQAKSNQKVTTDFRPDIPDRLLIEGETIRVTARDVVGVVKKFTNVANSKLVATDLNKLLEAGDIVTGDTSNATITVSSVESEPLKAAEIILTPEPSSAEPDDEFGFAESVTEYPDTLL
tara:strand:- start:11299 stop:12303 length:1005 start_codon:yes stop_codon:yes gene_type:complete